MHEYRRETNQMTSLVFNVIQLLNFYETLSGNDIKLAISSVL